MGWLMEMEGGLEEAAEQASPMSRPSSGKIGAAITRVVARHAGDPDVTRDVVAREVLGELESDILRVGPSSLPPSGRSSARSILGAPAAIACAAGGAVRPSSAQLAQMAAAVAARCGGTHEATIKALLRSMVGKLFTEDGAAVPALAVASSGGGAGFVRPPGPEALETIAERVLARAGPQVEAHVARAMIHELSAQLFGGEAPPSRQTVASNRSPMTPLPLASLRGQPYLNVGLGVSPHSLHRLESGTSQTSVRSRSIADWDDGARLGGGKIFDQDACARLNEDFQGLFGTLCNTIFAQTPPASGRPLCDYSGRAQLVSA